MPAHDWTRVDAGLFHAFHHQWITTLCASLNSGVLPAEYFALPEQRIKGPIPDVLALKLATDSELPDDKPAGVAVASAPPRTRLVQHSEAEIYANKADRIAVRHRHGEIIAVVEIVSPGNKTSKAEFKHFVQKSVELIQQGVHVLVVDLFPPGKRDPKGIHNAIWGELSEVEFEPIPGKPLVLASFDAGEDRTAYVEPFGVGDTLIDMPIFLAGGYYIPAPLEEAYQAAWKIFPNAMKKLLEPSKGT